MAVAIRYRTPYEVAIQARDLGSGKPVTNILYFRCQKQIVAPPAFGAPIAGPSDIATFAGGVLANWEANVVPLLNANYKLIQYVFRAMLGKRYGTPIFPITALIPGTPIALTTGIPHGLNTGDTVSVQGVTSPAVANGQYTCTVTGPNALTLNGTSVVAVWSGDGYIQKVAGPLQIFYADKYTLSSTAVGGVVGDALPLFATLSVRRFNGGVGRHFRSRISLSPISESDGKDGTITPGVLTAFGVGLNLGVGDADNGGSDAGSKLMTDCVFSKAVAFSQASPWTQSDTFMFDETRMNPQPNTGSLVRRKPRLTAAIV
jgi:hypothetical protein